MTPTQTLRSAMSRTSCRNAIRPAGSAGLRRRFFGRRFGARLCGFSRRLGLLLGFLHALQRLWTWLALLGLLRNGRHRNDLGAAKKAGNPVRRQRADRQPVLRSEEHTSEIQSLMRISYAVC